MGDNDARNRENQGADKGKNLGQGVANISDKDRRDQAGTGSERAPTKDQRQAGQGEGEGDQSDDR